jgi:glucosyl-3-phosphoglycerate synthase
VVSFEQGAADLRAQHPTYGLDAFSTDLVTQAKGSQSVSVVIPARNEARTIAAVVTAIAQPHLASRGGSGLVDELVVIDDASSDDTAALAERAGARVVTLNGSGGKGQAMAAGLEATTGDFLVYFDGDVENTHERYVPSLLGPLLMNENVRLVKGYYERPLGGSVTGGGRVTELVARPLLELLFPELSFLVQPLAGETAAARSTFERTGFDAAYRVEMGLLLDVANAFGCQSIAQVDLGTRVHRNRPIDELRPMARDVMEAAMSRSR